MTPPLPVVDADAPPVAGGEAAGGEAATGKAVVRDETVRMGANASAGATVGGTAAPPPPFPQAGDRTAALLAEAARVTGLDVLEVLGRGGMGVVLKARDPRLDRFVAVKLPIGGALTDPAAVARFRTEAKAIASVQHPHVAAVYAVGGEDDRAGEEPGGTPFLVMEYLPGGTLADRTRGEPQPAADAARLTATLARAVAALHARGVLHRDLKPANVMFAAPGIGLSGTPKIGDFGLAKRLERPGPDGDGVSLAATQTKTGEILGTPSYMAPEQAGGVYKLLGPPCDVYALGAMLYELCTGRPPFRGPDVLQTVLQVLSDDPVPPRRLNPATPRDLETICLKCLAKSPRKRYADAVELADDLDRFLNGEPVAARPAGRVEKVVRWVRRHPARAGLFAVTAASLLALIGGSLWYNAQLREELDRSTRLVESGRGLARFLSRTHLEELASLSGATASRERLSDELVSYLTRVAAVVEERRDAGDAPLALELAEAFNQVGAVQLGVGGSGKEDVSAALAAYDRADELYDLAATAAAASGDRQSANDVRRKRVLLRQNRAEALQAGGDYSAALAALAEADGLLVRLGDDDVLGGRDLWLTRASVWGNVASNHTAAGDPNAAAAALDTAAALLDQAAAAPRQAGANPADLSNTRAVLEDRRGALALRTGDFTAARDAFERSLEIGEDAAARDPDSDLYAANLGVTLARLANLDQRDGDTQTAIAKLQRAEAIHRRRIARDPQNDRAQRNLLTTLESLLVLIPGEEAVPKARDAVALADKLAAQAPDNLDAAHQRLIVHDALGLALSNAGRHAEAYAAHRHVRDLVLEHGVAPERGVAPDGAGTAGEDRVARRLAAEALLRMALTRILGGGELFETGALDPPAAVAAAEREAGLAIQEFAPLIAVRPDGPTPPPDLLAQAKLAVTLRDYCRDQPWEALADMAVMRGEPRPRTPLIAPRPRKTTAMDASKQ